MSNIIGVNVVAPEGIVIRFGDQGTKIFVIVWDRQVTGEEAESITLSGSDS